MNGHPCHHIASGLASITVPNPDIHLVESADVALISFATLLIGIHVPVIVMTAITCEYFFFKAYFKTTTYYIMSEIFYNQLMV
jgi:hypothetical protein